MGSPLGVALRFDQVTALHGLVRAVSSASIAAGEALDELAAIRRMPPSFGWPVRVLGHAVMTVGLALLLQPTWGAVVAAFVVSVVVFVTLRHGPPKLVTFLPAFWLLVPGGTGLIGVTALLGDNDQFGGQATVDTLVTVMSIALGVLIGTALYRATDDGLHTLGRFLPNPGHRPPDR
jgi:uncharacterized membrane protein YjjB (DUF3815 family)